MDYRRKLTTSNNQLATVWLMQQPSPLRMKISIENIYPGIKESLLTFIPKMSSPNSWFSQARQLQSITCHWNNYDGQPGTRHCQQDAMGLDYSSIHRAPFHKVPFVHCVSVSDRRSALWKPDLVRSSSQARGNASRFWGRQKVEECGIQVSCIGYAVFIFWRPIIGNFNWQWKISHITIIVAFWRLHSSWIVH